MNYKIKITEENQEIVRIIANDNEMNPNCYDFSFNNRAHDYYVIINDKFEDFLAPLYYVKEQLTTEQFIELFDKKPIKVFSNGEEIGTVKDLKGSILEPKKETELEKGAKILTETFAKEKTELKNWLEKTKAKNLSCDEIESKIVYLKHKNKSLYDKLEGEYSYSKAKYLFNKWQKETEFNPKRGDRVLVWDNDENNAVERIFVTASYKNMKPITKEEPKDFKTKVVELIEKRIGLCNEIIEENKNLNRFKNAALWQDCKGECQEILKQIKDL